MNNSTLRRFLAAIAILAVLIILLRNRELIFGSALPESIIAANGRIESIQVDVSAKESGRVKVLLAKEGDLVQPGQIVARMDTVSLDAELAQAKARVAEQEAATIEVKAAIVRAESVVKLAKVELARSKSLVAQNAGTREEFDQRDAEVRNSEASLEQQKARLNTARESVNAAKAQVAYLETRLIDYVLKSPVRGRVLYRLAELGEILPTGGKVFTLINLEDVFMEVFLPSRDATRVKIGAEARIVLDAAPQHSVTATVTFVAPEAQFTPKQVETRSERDKLMFRVKLTVPSELIIPFIDRVKTGVRGIGYIRLDDSVPWPAKLDSPFPLPEKFTAGATSNADPGATETGKK
jgi:HlyD family secretion protein